MRKIIQLSLALTLSALLPFSSLADTIYAIQDGDWHNPATWDKNRIPESTDDVYVQGFTVYISPAVGDLEVNNLTLNNTSGGSTASLVLDGMVALHVKGNFLAKSNNVGKDVEVQLFSGAKLDIDGNANFLRSQDNQQANKLKLNIQEESSVRVGGDFTFDYQNGGTAESAEEIYINNGARLSIGGSTNLYIKDGQYFNFDIYNNSTLILGANLNAQMQGGRKFFFNLDASSTMSAAGDLEFLLSAADDFMNINLLGACDLGGNVKLHSTHAGKSINMVADGSAAVLDIEGDFLMDAVEAGNVALALQQNAKMNLGGNFLRPNAYGALFMDASSQLILDGDQQQIIPTDIVAGGGNDRFSITNILFENTSGEPMLLTGSLTVKKELKLTDGVIKVSEEGEVIVADGAIISGGSNSAYIDGPVTKRGSTNGTKFVFPTGDGDIYAPLEISSMTHPDDEYTIQYRDDPPPILEDIKSPVSRINGRGHWSIRRKPGSTIPDVTLNWMDADARGIDDMENVVVVFVDTTANSAHPEWMSLGKSNSTGAVGAGISGSVTNSLDDPPPIEDQGFLTIGFTGEVIEEEMIPLSGTVIAPIELTMFNAKQHEKQVNVEWETSYESSSHRFEVERSSNYMDFSSIEKMPANGDYEMPGRYAIVDFNPHVGQNYYRLKVINADGSFHYSQIVSVFIKTFDQSRLYPNPVRDELHLFLGENRSESIELEIFDQLGRVIFSGNWPIENGELLLSTDEMNIREGGNYYLRVKSSDGYNESFKFIKSY